MKKPEKGQKATANWENPRRTDASINSKYCCLQSSTLCNSPISSTKNYFSTLLTLKIDFFKKIPSPT
jgi:hypothetical protein